MYIKYMARLDNRIWNSRDKNIWENLNGEEHFSKGVYIHPSEPEENVWLWMVGHEKAHPNKTLINRVFQNRWVIHYCVGGKGYYNGEPITAGKAFISWDDIMHDFVTDPDDPIEFYWIMIRGEEMHQLISRYGFYKSKLIFDCDYVDSVVKILDNFLNEDFSKVYLPKYNIAMIEMVLSYQLGMIKRQNSTESEILEKSIYGEYLNAAKNILNEENFSISVDELANMLGVTSKHLTKIFNSTLKETPKRYITRKRMELAKDLLSRGVLSTKVAQALRYTDYTSFYRSFIREYGEPPSNFVEKKK